MPSNPFSQIAPKNNQPWTGVVEDYQSSQDAVWRGLGVPSRRQEDWKYTSLNFLEDLALRYAPSPLSSETPKFAAKIPSASEVHAVFVDGHFMPNLSKANSGVSFVRGEEIRANPELRLKFESLIALHFKNGVTSYFEALSTSFAKDLLFVVIAKNAKVDNPIVLDFVSSSTSKDDVRFPRVVVLAEEQSKSAILERHSSLGGAGGLSVPSTIVSLAAGANVEYVKACSENLQIRHLATSFFYCGRDSQLSARHINSGNILHREDIHAFLMGEGAAVALDGLFSLRGEQHCDFHTWINHRVGHTQSSQLYKGILDDQSRGVFNGAIRIDPDAQKSQSEQLSRNLLLSSKAEVDAKPQLEIFADDVKAAHGATVGQIDAEEIFYLMSRSIGREQAERMLMQAFADEVIHRIKNTALRGLAEQVFQQESSV